VDYCVVNGSFIFQPPIAPPGTDTIDRSYPYASTANKTRDPHHGVEFYNASGTPVLAAAGGTVYYAGDDSARKFSPWLGFYGNIVVLEHPLTGAPFDTLYTLYAHLSKIDVMTGQVVIVGEQIGSVGMTGTASGSHLHFEVRIDPNDYFSTMNPELWLIPHPGHGSLSLLALDHSGTALYPSFTVQYFPDRTQPAAAAFQVDGYTPEKTNPLDPWNEVAALSDQPAGSYRITYLWAGLWEERWIEIQPGKLTRVSMTVK
jgi:murein DD-endopeptidase MepM/ murein hydrolase activator NlpD